MRDKSYEFKILDRVISDQYPTYFIADIAANHDGSLDRAKELIWLAAESGADAAKFQHFEAKTIVSDFGFKSLGVQQSHQSSWQKSVFDVYQDASVNLEWTAELKETCDKVGIPFFTTPYSLEVVDFMDPFVPAYKIGSGDITWLEMIKKVSSKQKPYMIATGASTMDEVDRAVAAGLAFNKNIAIMQCNTNYTANLDNFKYIHLNVLKTYRCMYPEIVLGLSDHTPGHATVLGAVALGARLIEKHFTDDTNRCGPDHKFSMNPSAWREMVDRTRELELALGSGIKRVEGNELETVVLQRRSLRSTRSMRENHIILESDFIPLRPCPSDAVQPSDLKYIVGRTLKRDIPEGDYIKYTDII